MKIEKLTDVCITSVVQTSVNFSISTYFFSADITPEILKLSRVTKVRVFFLVLVYVFNCDLFKFSAANFGEGSTMHLLTI